MQFLLIGQFDAPIRRCSSHVPRNTTQQIGQTFRRLNAPAVAGNQLDQSRVRSAVDDAACVKACRFIGPVGWFQKRAHEVAWHRSTSVTGVNHRKSKLSACWTRKRFQTGSSAATASIRHRFIQQTYGRRVTGNRGEAKASTMYKAKALGQPRWIVAASISPSTVLGPSVS